MFLLLTGWSYWLLWSTVPEELKTTDNKNPRGEQQMGMLDALLKNPEMMGDIAKFAMDNPEIAKSAMKMLSSSDGAGGGLGGIVSSLQSGGLGDAVSSWLGSGDNLAVAPDQLAAALGPEKVSQFADQAGISGSEAGVLLSGLLPQIVDKLSPDGALPDSGGLDGMLQGLIGSISKSA
jgi:uncharacterized protein YidB (DUF937 family)